MTQLPLSQMTKEEIAEQIRQEELAECTFRPTINPTSKGRDKGQRRSWVERLSQEVGTPNRGVLQSINERQEMERKELTFKPKINTNMVPHVIR